MPRPRDPYEKLARAIIGCPMLDGDDDGAPRVARGPSPLVARRRRRAALRLVGGDAGPTRAPHPDGPRPVLVLLK
jgi:hypothetical protein